MPRFEKVDGYNAIKDNENEVYTLCEYEPKCYTVGDCVDDILHLLNELNEENHRLKNQIAYMQSKIEEADE